MTAIKFPGAGTYVPEGVSLRTLSNAVQACHGCDLYRHATQAVFGEGRAGAPIVMLGEQPGDQEDRAGRPFVGPAGTLLNRALADAGIDRSDIYITNAVKHFKFEERGKRRIHKKPTAAEVVACRPWLQAELERLRPEVLVCLGATALQSVFGNRYRVLKDRGHFFEHPMAKAATVTVHPAAILRASGVTQRETDYQAFVKDLSAVRLKLAELA